MAVDVGGLDVADARFEPDDAELDRLRKKRDSAGWYAVVGMGLLFAGSFSTAMAVGGVFMVGFGAVTYLYWSRRIVKADDPWDDEELDRWERDEFHR